MKKVGVAILGLGTVGGGTYEILVKNHDYIMSAQKLDITVEAVLELNRQRALDLGIEESKIYSNMAEVVSNPNVDIVVEVIGGIEPAKTFILTALKNGKAVVTANKELISKYWFEIEEVAKKHHAGFYFEASCVGGVPIIRTLIDGMQANHIQSLTGIINGTTNFILSKMSNEGLGYDEVLKEAQANGFAEANPTADVEGFDASYKLSILASLAFNRKVSLDKVYREGITGIDKVDIALGKGLGYTLKLLAIGKDTDQGIEVRVHPAFVKNTHPLASVDGSFNAVLLKGDAVDDIMLYGRGAGALPTGSAIVSDIVYAAKQTDHYYVPFENTEVSGKEIAFVTNFETEYYLRLQVADQTGVLAKICGVLGDHGVSLTEVMQKGVSVNNTVTVIFITHRTHEESINAAVEVLKNTDYVKSVDAIIRVEE